MVCFYDHFTLGVVGLTNGLGGAFLFAAGEQTFDMLKKLKDALKPTVGDASFVALEYSTPPMLSSVSLH